MSLIESAENSTGKMNTWMKVADLGVNESTMIMTEQMRISGPLNRSATGVNNINVLKKENGINSSITDLETPKELN